MPLRSRLRALTKFFLVDPFILQSRSGWRDYNLAEVGLEGRVSDKDEQKIKQRLAAEFHTVFSAELGKGGFPTVEAAGPNVLLLRPALINVNVIAPDTKGATFNSQWVKSAGSMTLFMELYDSSSGTLLARVIDPQRDDNMQAQPADKVTNKAAADNILRDWAALLAEHLKDVRQAK